MATYAYREKKKKNLKKVTITKHVAHTTEKKQTPKKHWMALENELVCHKFVSKQIEIHYINKKKRKEEKKKTLKTFYIIGKKPTQRMLEKVLALVETCWITMSKFSVWDTLETRFAFQKSNVSHCTTFEGNIFPGNQLFFSQSTKQHQTNKFSSDSIGR